MVSVRAIIIFLLLTCSVLTAFVCTFTAVLSADNAIRETKKSRDTSLDNAFQTGEEAVEDVTLQYIVQIAASVEAFTLSYLTTHRLLAEKLIVRLHSVPLKEAESWTFLDSLRGDIYSTINRYLEMGLVAYGVYGAKYQSVMYGQNILTVGMPLEQSNRSIWLYHNEGTEREDPAYPANQSILLGSAGADGRFALGWPSRGSPIAYCNPATMFGEFMMTGRVADFVCRFPEDIINGPSYSLSMMMLSEIGTEGSRWTPLFWQNGFTAMSLAAAWGDPSLGFPQGVSGIVSAALDVRTISLQLQRIQVGGPGLDSHGRIYLCVRGAYQRGILAAASRSRQDDIIAYGLVHSVNASDDLIRRTAIFVEGYTGKEGSSHGLTQYEAVHEERIVRYRIQTNRSSAEDFYLRSFPLSDGHGINWWVNILVDRYYVLGEVDNKLRSTRIFIQDSERSVSKDLDRARKILYFVVVFVSVALIAAGGFFVMRITAPIHHLAREMASVAVMDLEAVDTNRKLSSLSEVADMQESFRTMIENLIEYRNYMPASILQQESGLEDEKPMSESGLGASSSSGLSFVNTGTGVRKFGELDLRKKRVTLAVGNLVSFFGESQNVQSCSEMQERHVQYISIMLEGAKQFNGVPDGFTGDRVFISWNASRPSSSHALSSCRFASKVMLSGDITLGICSGETRCGNMGTTGMKKFSYAGPTLNAAFLLERLNKVCSTKVLIDPECHQAVEHHFVTRLADVIKYEKLDPAKPVMVRELLEEMELREEEWMYQIQSSSAQNPYCKFDEAFLACAKGKKELALAALSTCEIKAPFVDDLKARILDLPSTPCTGVRDSISISIF